MDIDALDAGLAFAGAGLLLDGQTERLADAMAGLEQPSGLLPADAPTTVQIQLADETIPAHDNSLNHDAPPPEWDFLIGQTKIKRQARVYAISAQKNGQRFPHALFASNLPGVGKTHISRLIAGLMGVRMYELVPPFNIDTIVEAIQSLNDGDILFVDEIHKLADNGKRGAEILLKILEEGWAPVKGVPVHLPDVTIIGATTDPGRLPQPVRDRFKWKPYFVEYTIPELTEVAITFAYRHESQDVVTNQMAYAIAQCCLGTPRITEELVMAVRALSDAYGTIPEPYEMLEFTNREPDGLTPQHLRYLTGMRSMFRRVDAKGNVAYMSGQPTLQQIVQADKDDFATIETVLIMRGYVDKTPQGRRLTESGIAKAEALLAEGKGITR